ncbi:MAG TPA: thiamine diphosphokinase [Candidatus Eisenbacteria bacterium]|jgi:thiamine pyrophosphokinase
MPRAVILANGVPPSLESLRRALADAALFVCADGGANAAREFGLVPDAIVGDLDSISAASLAHFQGVPIVHIAEQDRTDAEKAVEFALSRGSFEEITLFGATAGRLDHVIGHVALLRRFEGRTRLVLEDEHARAFLARGDVRLDLPAGTVVSFFALAGPAEGVTTENLRYPLVDRTLVFGGLDSVSNVVEREPAWIRIRKGEVVVFAVRRP